MIKDNYSNAEIVDLVAHLYRAKELSRGYIEPELSAYRMGLTTAIHILEDGLGICSHDGCGICDLEDKE